MKILFWTDGFWPRLGGIETQGFRFIEGMHKRGHEYIVVAQKDHPSCSHETHCGVPIWRFDFNALVSKRDLPIIRSIQAFLEPMLKRFRPDVIHLNAALGGSAFAFLLFIRLFSAPIILTAHAPNLYEGKIPPVIEKIGASVDRIGCVSAWVMREIETHLPQMKSKLRLIYNGLPLPKGPPTPLPFSPPTLLLFGRHSPEKGLAVGIDAFALLKKRGSNARLIIAGGGPDLPALKKLAEERNLQSSARFTGVLSDTEVLSAFNAATLVIVPSLVESFGLVILESMQHQRPVVASRVEGIPEVVLDGETGILVPPKDPVALCDAIESLLKQPEKAVQMGISGRARAILKFTIDQNLDGYEELYENVILG